MKDEKDNLIPDEDEEYERSMAELSRKRQQALEEAERRAEEEARNREKEERRERERQLAADRLELMKLRSGVIEESETIHEEHEEKREMSFGEKLSNFWYHYKVRVIFGVFLVAVVTFILVDEITRVRPDISVMMIANNGLAYREAELEEFFEKYAEDKNGDGKVKVSVMILPMDPDSSDTVQVTNRNKLMAQLQEGDDIMMITDSNTEETYLYMLNHDLDKDFPGNKYIDKDGLSLNFKFLAEELKFENMPYDIHLSLRTPTETLGDSKEEMQKNYDEAFVMFKKITDDLTARAEELNDPGLTTEPMKRPDSNEQSK
ncbi:MAG: hypothetical protein IKP95_06965 [Ruminococcus sp.]|nr:hypothetical protein [Ruminococcus sp.]